MEEDEVVTQDKDILQADSQLDNGSETDGGNMPLRKGKLQPNSRNIGSAARSPKVKIRNWRKEPQPTHVRNR